MRQEESIEHLILTRGWVVALCAGAAASGAVNVVTSSLAVWTLTHFRDLSLVTSGSILIAFGLRRVRANGVSLRTVAYPIGGMFMFAILTGFVLAGEAVIASAISTLRTDAPAEMTDQLDTLRSARSFWAVFAVIAGLVGLFTPVREPAS